MTKKWSKHVTETSNANTNRAGKNLSPTRRAALERAKDELRDLYGKPRVTSSRRRPRRRRR